MRTLLSIAIAMLAVASVEAKDIKKIVLTTTPQMHCEGCENKIKNALRFEKGIKDIKTSVEEQKVTVTYDADKTSVDKITDSMKKAGFEAKEKTEDKKK